MAGTYVRLELDQRAINDLLFDVTEMSARRAAGICRDRVRANFDAKGRRRTGALSRSIRARLEKRDSASRVRYSVGSSLTYAQYQEFGIGPVEPVKAKVLRFKPKGSATFIFRPRTRGFEGAHAFRDALNSITVKDFLP